MTTSQLALVVAGVVGFGTPAFAAWFERQREKARFAHERGLRDRDTLRLRLEGVADALDTLRRRAGAQFGVLVQQGPESADLAKPTADAFAAVHDAELALAKLGLWIDLSDGAGRAAYVCLHELDTVVTSIDVQRALGRYTDGFSFEHLEEHQSEAMRTSTAFIEQARERFGPQ